VEIIDGLSHTYMVGEKYLCPDFYRNGLDPADDWCMYCGDQNDTNRLCYNDVSALCLPMRDRAGAGGWSYNFGSAHAGGFNMIMCDGSAQSIRYDIEPQLHARLGNRKDQQPVDLTRL
jgi:prepilin-type processing-associated H-X9-DG protein